MSLNPRQSLAAGERLARTLARTGRHDAGLAAFAAELSQMPWRIEEFRPLLADRLAVTLLNRGELSDSDFQRLPGPAVRLTDDARRTVLNAWQRSRERTWPHLHLNRDVPAALLPLIQARLLARHLRGDLDDYLPWTMT